MRLAQRTKLLVILSVIGPGLIASMADNDPSGVAGYSVAGARYGYGMVWVLLYVTSLMQAVFQEICARMAVVTGKGLADLIREQFGVRVTLLAMSALLIANLATVVSEFAGVASASTILFGAESRYFVVPLAAFLAWWLVAYSDYHRVERVLLLMAFVYISYILSAILARPDWVEVGKHAVMPWRGSPTFDRQYVWMVVQIIGTSITPWGLFFIQSYVRDKGLRVRDLFYVRADAISGAMFTHLIAFFIMISCAATLYIQGIRIEDAAEAALALKPLAGELAFYLFAFGLLNAAMYGSIAVPLCTAYAVTESLGWESKIGRRVRESPIFMSIFGGQLVFGAVLALLPNVSLLYLILLPNIVGGVLLPVVLFLILRLANNRMLMGEYVNGWKLNVLAYALTLVLTVLSVILIVLSLA